MVLVFGLGALVVGSGAAWFHARTVVRPIQELTGASERIASGELDEPIIGSRGDEIGVLSSRFEQMRVTLKAAREESRRWTEELEKRVRERTRELEALSRSRSELLGKVISAQEEERLRISRELHDETAQELVLLVRRLEAVGQGARPDTAAHIDGLLQMARDTLRSVRRFSRDLRPAVLDDLGLVAAIEMVVEETSGRLSKGAQLKVLGEPRRVDRTIELALFRIAQEALRNVERHAGAASAHVKLSFQGDEIALSVSDDGSGFSPPRNLAQLARRGSLGLLGMKERAELVGGRFDLRSSPGLGSELTVTVEVT
jgi:signal transduction histidine kinase